LLRTFTNPALPTLIHWKRHLIGEWQERGSCGAAFDEVTKVRKGPKMSIPEHNLKVSIGLEADRNRVLSGIPNRPLPFGSIFKQSFCRLNRRPKSDQTRMKALVYKNHAFPNTNYKLLYLLCILFIQFSKRQNVDHFPFVPKLELNSVAIEIASVTQRNNGLVCSVNVLILIRYARAKSQVPQPPSQTDPHAARCR
jgi:hypothetical protein